MQKNILLNDKFILLLIIANSIIIFLQGFELNGIISSVLYILDNAITFVFLLEVISKLNRSGFRTYFKSNWNKLDFTLILLSLPSLYHFIFGESGSQLDYLLVFRITRVFKSFRFIRFFPNITHIIAGVQRAIKASIIVMFGFTIYIFIISVLSCSLFRNIAPEYFENPLVSIYSIFRVFTVEGWYEIPEIISSATNEITGFFAKLYFVIIVFTGGIIGLSIVNSIFVDAMVSDNNDDLIKKIEAIDTKIDELISNTFKN